MKTLRKEFATLLVCGAVVFSNCNAVEASASGESSIAGLNVTSIQIEEKVFDDHVPPPITPKPLPPPITPRPVPPPVVNEPPRPYQPHPQGPGLNTPPLATPEPNRPPINPEEVYGPPPPSGW